MTDNQIQEEAKCFTEEFCQSAFILGARKANAENAKEITALQTELSIMKERRAELIGDITRLEAANAELIEALTESKLQIEYMENKAGVKYGTTASILSRTEMILEKYRSK